MEEIGITETQAAVDPTITRPSTAVTDIGYAYTDSSHDDDLYIKYKKLQKQLEFLNVQEEYIKDEQRNLQNEYLHAQEEVRLQWIQFVL